MPTFARIIEGYVDLSGGTHLLSKLMIY